jgi:hypothetical protein
MWEGLLGPMVVAARRRSHRTPIPQWQGLQLWEGRDGRESEGRGGEGWPRATPAR